MDGLAATSVRRQRSSPDTSYESYHKMHKHFVGPATADKLVSLYEDMSQSQRPREMYAAGWAAAEAAIVGTQYGVDERVRLAVAARECWEYTLSLEQERSANSAWQKGTSPDTTDEYRVASMLALAPLIEAIPRSMITRSTLQKCQEQLIHVAELNNNDMLLAMRAGVEGRAANHSGLAFEQISPLGINRMMSSRIIGLFSLARSGTGFYYPTQTHDMMVLNMKRGNIIRVTPAEVKSTLKVKFSNRYEAALVGGKAILGENREMIGQTIEMLKRELVGKASPVEKMFLESLSNSIIHSLRHHHRAEKFGRHCLHLEACSLNQVNPLIAS